MAAFDDEINLQAIYDLEELEDDENNPNRSFHTRDDPFVTLSDQHFVRQFRVSKEMAQQLIEILEPVLNPPTRSSALDASVKVLTALNFFGYGCYQLNIGQNINTAISQSSVSRCIREVSDALNLPHIFRRFVKFPENVDQLRAIQNVFFQRYAFPGVIGCIDCTRVAIYPPKRNDNLYPEHHYVNRKGYHSLNVQLICDADLKILNVNARYPGSTNDAFIWNNGNVLPLLRLLHQRNHRFLLLGDSGYALRPWILTPVLNAQPNTPEGNYNEAQMTARSTIERCNGVLKMRFRCLLKHRALHYTPERASSIIKSCVLLHNFCIERNIPVPVEPEDEELDLGIINDYNYMENLNPELAAGRIVRQEIIRNYFRNP